MDNLPKDWAQNTEKYTQTQTHTQHVIHSNIYHALVRSIACLYMKISFKWKIFGFHWFKMCQHDLHEGFGRIINYYDAMMMVMMNLVHAQYNSVQKYTEWTTNSIFIIHIDSENLLTMQLFRYSQFASIYNTRTHSKKFTYTGLGVCVCVRGRVSVSATLTTTTTTTMTATQTQFTQFTKVDVAQSCWEKASKLIIIK